MTRVSRAAVALVAGALLTACSGGGPLSRASLQDQQDAADDVARLVVSTLVDRLAAAPPSDSSLGLGALTQCAGGDADQASYFVDTFVTYAVLPPAQATQRVAAALRAAGLKATVDAKTSTVSTSRDGVTVDLTSQEKGGGSAGQNIFVSTGCLSIGQQEIKDFNSAPPNVTP